MAIDPLQRATSAPRDSCSSGGGASRSSGIGVALLLVGLMTLGEIRLRERLLYRDHVEMDFVAASVAGIRAGRPAFRAWQHRILAPAAVAALAKVVRDDRQALRIFCDLMVACANLLLFEIVRRRAGRGRRAGLVRAVEGVALFGFVHLLLMYKLEYAWDGVDLVLFLAFGACVARGTSVVAMAPLLAIGTLNHETALAMPLWPLLSWLDPARRSAWLRREVRRAAVALLLMGATIVAIRARLYVGRPDLPGQDVDATTPFIDNHLHAGHNLRQLLIDDWIHGRALINAGILSVVVLLVVLVARRIDRVAALWTVAVFATIFCFGYLSETRLYLPLVAFWFGYAWSLAARDRADQPAPG